VSAAHGAAPGELAGELRGDATLEGTPASVQHPIAASDLPHELVERLESTGITTFECWVKLGRSRRMVWGVAGAAIARVDEAARGALEGTT
jgi:hypothetical protein